MLSFSMLFCICEVIAQSGNAGILTRSQISGNFQSDFQWYQNDKALKDQVQQIPQKMGSNSYLSLNYKLEGLTAGLRYESYFPALAGFDQRYNGNGIVNRFISYEVAGLEFTAGHFYEQFGSGMVLRSYQDWNLGFDNAIDGMRIKFSGIKGLIVKGLVGNQRLYFAKSPGTVRGADVDLNVNDAFLFAIDWPLKIQLGGSFVSKFQADADPLLKLPENVGVVGLRGNLTYKKLAFYAEFARKNNDPSFVNNFIYKPGEALYLTGSYATQGFGISLGAKRIDNMDFRSDRTATLNDALINYLPPLTPQHTYRLASLYPYVTQPLGEMAYQAEASFLVPKGTFAGGRFGTKITLNYSTVNNIYKKPLANRLGYESDYFKKGNIRYYENISADVSRKVNEKGKLALAYVYTLANNNVLRISDYKGIIYAHTFVGEFTQKLAARNTLKSEVQYLHTRQERGSWLSFSSELSARSFFIAFADDYNFENPIHALRLHYFSGSLGFKKQTTRVSATFGRQRAGVVCVGGICRLVPATSGLSISVSSSF